MRIIRAFIKGEIQMFWENECCGNCRFHQKDRDGEWICTNSDSDYDTDYTDYQFVCEEFEEKRK